MEPIESQPAPPTGWAPPSAPVPPPVEAVPATPVVGRRVAAGFIDVIPLALVLVAVSSDRATVDNTFRVEVRGLGLFVAVLTWAVYYGVTELLTGTSPGKRLLGLTVLDSQGGSPGAGTVAVRTLLRCIDVLPAFYLVGFVAMMANKDRRRLGDMVASTTVVSLQEANERADREGRSRPHTRGPLALLIGAFVLVLGVVGTVAKLNEVPAGDRLGSFEMERDIEPMVAEVMAAFARADVAELGAMLPDEVASDDDVAVLLEKVEAAVGGFTGDYEVIDHVRYRQLIPELGGTVELMDVLVMARFEQSQQQVIVTFGVIDGELTPLGLHL